MTTKTSTPNKGALGGLLRLNDVLALVPVSRSTFWAKVRKGQFPKPHHIGRIAVWSRDEISTLLDEIQGGE